MEHRCIFSLALPVTPHQPPKGKAHLGPVHGTPSSVFRCSGTPRKATSACFPPGLRQVQRQPQVQRPQEQDAAQEGAWKDTALSKVSMPRMWLRGLGPEAIRRELSCTMLLPCGAWTVVHDMLMSMCQPCDGQSKSSACSDHRSGPLRLLVTTYNFAQRRQHCFPPSYPPPPPSGNPMETRKQQGRRISRASHRPQLRQGKDQHPEALD